MANYATIASVEDPVYTNMGIEFVERGNSYVDDMIIRRRGLDPAVEFPDGTTMPPILKNIAVHRAQEMFCQSLIRRDGDVWALREETQRRERIRFEKRFDMRDVDTSNIDYTNKRDGTGIRLFRV